MSQVTLEAQVREFPLPAIPRKPEKSWRVEIYRNGDVLEWKLYRVVEGIWLPLEGDTALTVSDMFREAGQVLEAELPRMFS